MKKLIFTYNANAGLFNAIKDTVHKTLSPDTYDCKLCQITYGPLTMKEEWKEFIDTLDIEIEFLHKDEFLKKYKIKDQEFPNVFISQNDKIELLISNKEINKVESIKDLKKLVNDKLNTTKNK